jgi:hypothetical protein
MGDYGSSFISLKDAIYMFYPCKQDGSYDTATPSYIGVSKFKGDSVSDNFFNSENWEEPMILDISQFKGGK